MTLSDVTFSTEGIGVITVLIGGLVGALVFVFKMYVSNRDAQDLAKEKLREKEQAELDGFRKSYQEIAIEATKAARVIADREMVRLGKPPVAVVAQVVSESHSPSTSKQREDALVQSMRAQLAAVKISTEQPPREEPEHEPGSAYVPPLDPSNPAVPGLAPTVPAKDMGPLPTINPSLIVAAAELVADGKDVLDKVRDTMDKVEEKLG